MVRKLTESLAGQNLRELIVALPYTHLPRFARTEGADTNSERQVPYHLASLRNGVDNLDSFLQEMLRTRQRGWVYLAGDIRIWQTPDGKTGWYKVLQLDLHQTSKLIDNASCPNAGCHMCRKYRQVRRKRGQNKAKGKNKLNKHHLDVRGDFPVV